MLNDSFIDKIRLNGSLKVLYIKPIGYNPLREENKDNLVRVCLRKHTNIILLSMTKYK